MTNSEIVCNHVRKRKKDLISVFGSKCCICGFNSFQEGLDFHHVNPKEKSFSFGLQASTKALEKQLEELRKCILVCANCHRGIHANKILVPEDWNKFFNENRARELIEENELIRHGKLHYCQRCGKIITRKASYCSECSHLISRKADRPSREELKDLIRSKPFTQIALLFNVSDNAIRRWCDYYGLPRKKSEITKMTNEEWVQI